MNPVGRTIGLEIEFGCVSMHDIQQNVPQGWQVVRDGSCTVERMFLGNMPVAEVSPHLRSLVETRQVGGELVSPPFNLDEGDKYFQQVVDLLSMLRELNEQVTDLTSVHIHVASGVPPAYVLKNLFRWWLALEAFMYRISVAEHEVHRGVLHGDYMYSRPLTRPQVVKDDDGKFRWCFDMNKILTNGQTTDEVLKAFGRADQQPNKWMPFRYYGLNVGPIIRQETVEFRIFNETLRADYIRAWVELCQALVRLAYMDGRVSEYPWFPLGETRPLDGRPFMFDNFIAMVPPSLMSETGWSTLHHLYESRGWQAGPRSDTEQVNHLCRRNDRRVNLSRLPKRLKPELVDDEVARAAWNREE